jgi:transitional endoplasmic reticulum ATPase
MSVLVKAAPIAFGVVVVLIVTVKTLSWVGQTDLGGSKQAEEEHPSNPGVLIEETGNLGAAPFPPSSDRGEQFRNEESSRTSQDRDDSSTRTNIEWDELEFDWTRETDVAMADVGGMDELKQELERDIIRPLTTDKDKAESFDIPLPNTILYGPPGTGKTFLTRALATEIGLPFVKLSGSDVQTKWINESASRINTLFDEAVSVAESEGGAVVFLDELDAVLKRRSGTGNSHEEDNKVVAEFLVHLQEISESDILFVGATNRVDSLDPAATRRGRIDKKIHVGKPDRDAREAILRAQLSDRPHCLSDGHIEWLAEQTDGAVASDLESLVVAAARVSAFERDGCKIRWRDIKRVVDD